MVKSLGKWFALGLVAAVVLAAYGCSAGEDAKVGPPGSSSSGTGGAGAAAGLTDTDGDGISDEDEGAADNVDTDKDGKPDFQDDDSDGDGIPDKVEAGDSDPGTPPVDSDGDKKPDFRDDDSDNNGIPDKVEKAVDTDGNGIGDYADPDNDGDTAFDVDEIAGAKADCNGDLAADPEGTPEAPADCDGDGTPNYLDLDSDGDTISDKEEGAGDDTDKDGFSDRYDLDSDNDQFTDAVEAGDEKIETPAVDTDEDGKPDFRDPDSDSDGVSDLDEFNAKTDPKKQDTDGDGVSDLIEIAGGYDPLDPNVNPKSKGDFVFVVPYQDTSVPDKDTLEFATSIQFADVYFSFDTTGSMVAELAAMKNPVKGVPAIMEALRCKQFGPLVCQKDSECGQDLVCFASKCIEDPIKANAGAGCVPDMWTGAGRFDNCNTYTNLVHLQPDPQKTASVIPGTGGGGQEAIVQAAGCVANPNVCGAKGCSHDPSVLNPVGCPGFRPDAVRILMQITDADNQASNTCLPYKIADAGNDLKAQDIKFVCLHGTDDDGGANNGCTTPKDCAEKIGIAADTVDKNNKPFVYYALDAGVVDAAKKGVLELVRGVPLNVTIEATDEPNDAGDALQFIDYLVVNVSGAGKCTVVSPTADTNQDGFDDSFPALLGGTPVCWDVIPVQKQSTVPPADKPQLFTAKLTVKGDGSPLDDRQVFFLVPPKDAEIPPPPR
ncbi:MAG: hypothetical protein HY744_08225 [Deltaproteobacteria bacterium]|nr:hypothetical protein [Deltaproteobacteria bacterium]